MRIMTGHFVANIRSSIGFSIEETWCQAAKPEHRKKLS